MTAAERSLLLALFRWARADPDIQFGRTYWVRHIGEPAHQWGIDFHPEDFDSTERAAPMIIWRYRIAANRYWVASVTEAVDLLVALGIAPTRFSTAYQAGWDVGREDVEHPLAANEFRAVVPLNNLKGAS